VRHTRHIDVLPDPEDGPTNGVDHIATRDSRWRPRGQEPRRRLRRCRPNGQEQEANNQEEADEPQPSHVGDLALGVGGADRPDGRWCDCGDS
jgi:hypothetical protein